MGPGMMGQQGGMGMGSGQPGSGMGPGGMMMGPGQQPSNPFERPLIREILSAKNQLNLTGDQEQKLRRLRSEFEKESIRRGAEVQAAEVDLRDILAADTPNLGNIEVQVKRIGALQADLRFARIKVLQEGRAVLTKEQWQRFEALPVPHGPMAPGRGRRPGGQPG
jgi:Spy/CpxP family protein refolding chaperone